MRIVVSGVGTDVGKTWTAVALTSWIRQLGIRCVAVKPVESGGDADSCALSNATGFHVEPSPYRFAEPVGPHLAARHAGVIIQPEVCVEWVSRCTAGFDIAIVELAGGLLSPLSTRHTNADLLRLLEADAWVAVAVDRLGVLHDLKALLIATERSELGQPAVVLDAPRRPDASTGTNAAELEAVGTCTVSATLPRGGPTDAPVQAAVGRLAGNLGIAPAARHSLT